MGESEWRRGIKKRDGQTLPMESACPRCAFGSTSAVKAPRAGCVAPDAADESSTKARNA